jgi:hypothetical protein
MTTSQGLGKAVTVALAPFQGTRQEVLESLAQLGMRVLQPEPGPVHPGDVVQVVVHQVGQGRAGQGRWGCQKALQALGHQQGQQVLGALLIEQVLAHLHGRRALQQSLAGLTQQRVPALRENQAVLGQVLGVHLAQKLAGSGLDRT